MKEGGGMEEEISVRKWWEAEAGVGDFGEGEIERIEDGGEGRREDLRPVIVGEEDDLSGEEEALMREE